jgi:protein-tyrosine phosphatase
MLPGIDDGAPDLDESFAMAAVAVADGITVTACTPHIYPGLYENDASGIRSARSLLQAQLRERGIPLHLVEGADTHLVPEVLDGLRDGRIPTLNGSRYVLLEPPHHVAPPRFEESVFELMAAGYVPVLTHPERLTWIDQHYDAFKRLALRGAWIQITGGALLGQFGRAPRHWSERMLDDGIVHVMASDAHRAEGRAPRLSAAREEAAKRIGRDEADNLVSTRPRGVLSDADPASLPPIPALSGIKVQPPHRRGFWRQLLEHSQPS